MPFIIIEDFNLGLSSTKLPTTAKQGSARTLQNAHLTRGGEIEKRKAFVSKYSLPAGDTKGLHAVGGQLYVFGHGTAPAGLPAGVNYQRVQHPSSLALSRILDSESFDGKAYVVAEYSDGSRYHFYDGVRVDDWFDGRASAQFEVTAGSVSAGTQATGSIELTAGASGSVDTITVNGVDLLGGTPVAFDTDLGTTASNVATQINSYSSIPNYTANAAGAVITITASLPHTDYNGYVVAGTATTITLGNEVNMSGGVVPNEVTDVTVDGVSILSAPVQYVTDDEATAQAIVDDINATTTTPNYDATRAGAFVNVIAEDADDDDNGDPVVITTNNVTVSPTSTTMTGGADTSGTFEPGTAVKTFKKKMFAVSESLLHFSALNDPTTFTTDGVGAGFINMSVEDEGSEDLIAVEGYFNDLAVFSKKSIQIWSVSADPDASQHNSTLKNTGAIAANSVVAFGNEDVFYLSRSGIRSLRSRDINNNAYAADVGTNIDTIITSAFKGLTAAEVEEATAVIEPENKRYLLSLGTSCYVFSFFPTDKVAAWSEYTNGFRITDWAVIDDKLYARAGDTIYLYGGDAGTTYDTSEATIVLPFIDMKRAGQIKDVTSIDLAAKGEWKVYYNLNLKEGEEVWTHMATITDSTFQLEDVGMFSKATHIQFKFVCARAERAVIGNLVIHYTLKESG